MGGKVTSEKSEIAILGLANPLSSTFRTADLEILHNAGLSQAPDSE